MIKAVIFDLDETLFNRTESLRRFLLNQIAGFNELASIDPDTFIKRFIETDARGRVSKSVVYQRLATEFDIQGEHICQRLFVDYENNFWRHAVPFDGLDDMFQTFKANDLATAIVTNGQTHIQTRSIMALNLDRVVKAFLISESEGVRKPDVEIFHKACHILGLKAEQCVFVGDSPKSDISGAKKAGMRTVWFPNGASWPDENLDSADAAIMHLSELHQIIESWQEA